MLLPGPPGGALNTLSTTELRLYCRPALPLQKGVMLANFSWPAGGTYPRNPSIAPSKGGDAGKFFLACRGHVPAQPQHPPSKGEDAVGFSAPPPREVQCKIFLLALASVLCPRCRLDFETLKSRWHRGHKGCEASEGSPSGSPGVCMYVA